MSTKRPVISVVVPAYNEEKYLPKTLEALKNQDFDKTYEIIVVNNNSTDNTEAVARSFNARIINEKKQGLILAKQAGCKRARGKIIAVLNVDCIPPCSWLHIINQVLNDPKTVAVTGWYHLPNAPWWAKAHQAIGLQFIKLWQLCTKNSPLILAGNVAFKNTYFKKIGGYDTRYTSAADEIKLRNDLKKLGCIRYDERLDVTRSARRFKSGSYHYFIEYLLIGYILNYLSTTLFKKPLPPPANIREDLN
jgi:glycosyltransferase involved in cell wall biosynthesis